MYSPITSTSPASDYVGIDQSITYGSAGTTILASTAGITDTGTTLVLLASGTSSCYIDFPLTDESIKLGNGNRRTGYIPTDHGRRGGQQHGSAQAHRGPVREPREPVLPHR